MTDPPPTCPDCRRVHDLTDNYCRNCGMFLAATRDVATVEPNLPATRPRASLPAPVRRAVTAVAVGAAVQVGMSLAGKYLLKQAAKQALSAPARTLGNGGKKAIKPSASGLPDDVVAVNETVVVHRAWFRR
ncbi:MAG: hypothetical protein ACE5EF_11510 [Dehalococcoidia bacterium]